MTDMISPLQYMQAAHAQAAHANASQGSGSGSSSSSATGGVQANESTFLTLLVEQLKNQDPLNPTDSTQFVSELAQFSSVEQLVNINQNVATMTGTISGAASVSTASNALSGGSSSSSDSSATASGYDPTLNGIG